MNLRTDERLRKLEHTVELMTRRLEALEHTVAELEQGDTVEDED